MPSLEMVREAETGENEGAFLFVFLFVFFIDGAGIADPG